VLRHVVKSADELAAGMNSLRLGVISAAQKAVLAFLTLGLGCTGPNPAYRTDVRSSPDGTTVRPSEDAAQLDANAVPVDAADAPFPPADAAGDLAADAALKRDVETDAGATAAPDVPADRALRTVVSVDDRIVGPGVNRFTYGPGWQWCDDCMDPALYQGSNTFSKVRGDEATFAFEGTRIRLYGVLDPTHGWGAVSVDNGPEKRVDLYDPARFRNVLLWTSDELLPGPHKLKVRVTGDQTPGSSDIYVTIDRVEIEF
jgi:hypothetical protein